MADLSKTRELYAALARRTVPARARHQRAVERLERDCAAGQRRDGDCEGHPSRWPAWTDDFYYSPDLD